MVRVRASWVLKPGHPKINHKVLSKLAQTLREAQEIFAETGGLHAAGLFKPDGSMILSREDVGRHNALDKLIGRAMQTAGLPLSDFLCVVSGRAGFELVQKAWMAGFPVFAAVGAPSSLAVELADQQNMTLIGFLRSERWNVYTDAGRMLE
jgi:FdhD protein